MALGIAFAGCTGRDGAETSTPTSTPTPTRTQAQGLGTIEYTVTNADDVAHRLEIAMENAEGRVVQETHEPELAPGAAVSSGSAGEPPEMGPYTLHVRTETGAATYVWDVRDCSRIDLAITITADGTIAIDRRLCQN